MGFGLLFIGYFIAFLMSLNNYGFAFEIVGFAIILSSLGRLSEYKRSVSYAAFPLLVMALCSVFEGFRQLDSLLSLKLPLFTVQVAFTVSLISAAATLFFHFLLLLPIREIAAETGEKELASKSYSALSAASVACALELAVALIGSFSQASEPSTAFRVLTLASVLFHIFYPVFSLVFIYSCYAKLCAPEDADMAPRPSRFAFINRMRAKQEEKARETQRFREEYQQKVKNAGQTKDTASKSKKK